MEKQYTLNTLLGEVTATPKVLNEFICGYYAIACKLKKRGFNSLAKMYEEEANKMFDELEKIKKRG